MLQHIVFFRLTNTSETEKEEIISTLQTKLLALKDKVDVIKHLECGKNISNRVVAYDIALFVSIADENALEQYRIHPAHQKVLEYIKELKPETAVVDYLT